jgi:hypothetical protein
LENALTGFNDDPQDARNQLDSLRNLPAPLIPQVAENPEQTVGNPVPTLEASVMSQIQCPATSTKESSLFFF